MTGLEKGITKEAIRMAWPAVCESFFIALAAHQVSRFLFASIRFKQGKWTKIHI